MMEMLVLLGFLAVVDVLALSSLPSTWSGKGLPGLERRCRAFWVWGEDSLQGFLRANPVAIVGATGLWLAGFGATLFEVAEAPILRTVVAYVFLAGTVVAAGCLGLAATVILFNAPKQLVPPGLRHQSGLMRNHGLGDHDRAKRNHQGGGLTST
jgi:hypothetical protein